MVSCYLCKKYYENRTKWDYIKIGHYLEKSNPSLVELTLKIECDEEYHTK